MCPLRVYVLKFNPYEVLKGWKVDPSMVFTDETFGRQLELDKIIRVELLWPNSYGFARGEEKTRQDMFSYSLPLVLQHFQLPTNY